jgi:hypothetical protein
MQTQLRATNISFNTEANVLTGQGEIIDVAITGF